MWGRDKNPESVPEEPRPQRLRDALHQARVEAAERTGIVVDLRDAEAARLELVSDALDPLFDEIPDDIDLFDRGVSRGDTPRLWIDPVAHVHMGRDKRTYRFVLDSRYGRKVAAESAEVDDLVQAITHYVARRMLERERALAADDRLSPDPVLELQWRRRSRWRAVRAFVFGVVVGVAAVFAAAWIFVDVAH
jgi:hypothetical protein